MRCRAIDIRDNAMVFGGEAALPRFDGAIRLEYEDDDVQRIKMSRLDSDNPLLFGSGVEPRWYLLW